jgi:hypothetical protein
MGSRDGDGRRTVLGPAKLGPEDFGLLENEPLVCTNCGGSISIDDALKGKCPKCGHPSCVDILPGLDF